MTKQFKIKRFCHPFCIIAYTLNMYKKKLPIWIPYPNEISVKGTRLIISYKGGEFKGDVKKIHSIMFYGSICTLREDFLEICRKYSIPICIYRRNMLSVIWIHPSYDTNVDDILTKQILVRENKTKQKHITYKLLKAKFESMSWLIKKPLKFRPGLSIDKMRSIEAIHAKMYWKKYYELLGYSSARRDEKNEVSGALNAVSKFVSSIILRWVLFHNMSPHHGFLHIPTEYPALVYDLIEPYRGFIEKRVFDAMQEAKNKTGKIVNPVGIAITAVEDFLDMEVYTHTTRQIVTFQELLHGSVLALRAYLSKDANRFIVPMPGENKGGRPLETGYKLYGRGAGIQNYFTDVEALSERYKTEGI